MPGSEESSHGDAHRAATTVYLFDPGPQRSPWPQCIEYCLSEYDLRTADWHDAQRRGDDRYNEIKTCVMRTEQGRRGAFRVRREEFDRLRPHDEYIFVVYDRLPKRRRTPDENWWVIKAHVRISVKTLQAAVDAEFDHHSDSGAPRFARRVPWPQIPGFRPRVVCTEATVDCNQFVE